MEEVLEKLGSTLIGQDGNETGKTNFDGLYKNWGKFDNQEQRRRDMLDIQRGNRNSVMDKFRGIMGLVEAVDSRNIFKDYKSQYRPQIYVAGFTRTAYNNVLMMSEWMIEKPEDFHENWYVVPCPKGVRTLVVASQGSTKCFTKYGHFRLECHTALPGGNTSQPAHNSRCCILDCFHVESTNTMYVLDILGWNSQPMADGETEFRHFWLQSQLEEIAQLKVLSKRNKLLFKILPKVPCDPKSFNEFMMTIPHFDNYTPKLDGLLFYHKKAHYFAGQTPLVGWLFPFMVPEVIGADVKVNPAYMLEKPDNYVNQADFIQKFEEKAASNKRKDRKKKNKMDTTTSTPVEKETKSSLTETEPMEADVPKDSKEETKETNTEQKKEDKSEEKME